MLQACLGVALQERRRKQASESETRSRATPAMHTTSGKRSNHLPPMPTTGFHYVYILRDVATGQHHYTGVTQNLQERLVYHNSGREWVQRHLEN